MIKKIYQKAVVGILFAGLSVGLLAGCQKTAENKQENTQNASRGEEKSKTTAMGRYRETEIELPDEVKSQELIQFFRGKEGKLELYTTNREASGTVIDTSCYIYQDNEWKKEENWIGNAVLNERAMDLCHVFYGKDGNYYLGGTDEDYRYHFFRLKDDGTAEELLEEIFQPEEGKDYGLIPPNIEILEDGSLLVYAYDEVHLYTPSGSRIDSFSKDFSMAKDFTGTTSDHRGYSENGEFITVQEDNLVRYSLEDGNLLETISFDEIKSRRPEITLFGDGQGGIYAAGETGLAHINRGGSLWEILIDGSLTHMGMRSIYLKFFFEGDHQDYYAAFTAEAGKGIQLFHYEYDPNMEAVPPNVLTIYSLQDHSTIRQAASQFQSDHPEVKVEMRTAVDNGETITEEMIQSLNTELLSQKGADILILDGLPADSYIEKGVLMDMHELIEEIKNSDTMLDNIFDGFAEEDGAVYQIPARISFPLILGNADALQAYSSLTSMTEYSGEKPLVMTDNYENLVRKIAHLQYRELIESGKIMEKDGLLQLLTAVKSIGEHNGSKTSFTLEEIEENYITNNVTADGIIGTSVHYDQGKCESGMERIDGYSDLCIPMEVRRHYSEAQTASVNSLYFPSALTGINRSTENKDLAEEFIRCLLSYEVQKENLYDGFPVNKTALLALTEKDTEGYAIGVGFHNSDYVLTAGWPTLDERKEAVAIMENLSVPVIIDETVLNMIIEGSRNYFDDHETAEQAAEKILRKLSIYQAE